VVKSTHLVVVEYTQDSPKAHIRHTCGK